MRPNASGTTRANTSLTIGSLNDRKIFVTRSSAGSITCGTIRKRSKAYFVLFFNSHVELLMRVYIASRFPTNETVIDHEWSRAWLLSFLFQCSIGPTKGVNWCYEL